MLSKTVVSIFYLLFFVLVAAATESDKSLWLAHFGLQESSPNVLFNFQSVYKMTVNIDLGELVFKTPERLDCNKYTIKSDHNRIKREVSSGPKCLYDFSVNETLFAGAQEERQWANILDSSLKNVYCEDNFPDNCVLRRLHSSYFTITWRKRFNAYLNSFEIVPDYQVFNIPRDIDTFKEVLYHTDDMVNKVISGEPIEISYRCLAVDKNIIEDRLVRFVERERQRLLQENYSVLLIFSYNLNCS